MIWIESIANVIGNVSCDMFYVDNFAMHRVESGNCSIITVKDNIIVYLAVYQTREECEKTYKLIKDAVINKESFISLKNIEPTPSNIIKYMFQATVPKTEECLTLWDRISVSLHYLGATVKQFNNENELDHYYIIVNDKSLIDSIEYDCSPNIIISEVCTI